MAFTRPEFDAARARARKAGERDARRLAVVAVAGGIIQLLFIRWADRTFGSHHAPWIEGGLFVVYMVIIVGLLRRLLMAQRSGSVACPACGARLEGTSLAVASATGRCEKCGGVVIEG